MASLEYIRKNDNVIITFLSKDGKKITLDLKHIRLLCNGISGIIIGDENEPISDIEDIPLPINYDILILCIDWITRTDDQSDWIYTEDVSDRSGNLLHEKGSYRKFNDDFERNNCIYGKKLEWLTRFDFHIIGKPNLLGEDRKLQIEVQRKFLELVHASDYMGIDSLTDLLAKLLAQTIDDLIVLCGGADELRKIFSETLDDFGFTDDITPDRREEVEKENSWINNIKQCSMP